MFHIYSLYPCVGSLLGLYKHGYKGPQFNISSYKHLAGISLMKIAKKCMVPPYLVQTQDVKCSM